MKMKRKTLHTIAVFLTMLIMGITGKGLQAQNVITVTDSIYTNTTWTACNQYLVFGYVYVTAGHTLTIDPGTIIKGDKNSKGTIIVERGAQIIAQGTAAQPIVFTSNQPMGQRTYGDWGGVILCGKAPTNWLAGQQQVEGGPRSFYGGTLPNDNSGIMTYCRLEFGGIAFSPNNEVNGLTMCAVGRATTINHIQVSFSGDDSYEWFGGTVNCKYLVSYRAWDDDFDTDCGYSGNVQFGFVQRDPFAADQSGSKSFESDSYQSGTKTGLAGDTTGLTRCVFANITCIGPLVNPTSTAYDNQFVSAAHIRRGSAMSLINCVIAGYPAGILFDESSASYGSTTANYRSAGVAGDSVGQIRGTVVCGIPTNGAPARKELMYVINGARSLTPTTVEGDTTTGSPFASWSGPFNLFQNTPTVVGKHFNKMYPTQATGIQLHNPYNLSNPDPTPNSTSPLCYNSTSLPAQVIAHYVALGQPDHFGNGNKYPFLTANPINLDTSNFFNNYNAPATPPTWNSSKTPASFFTRTNYTGGFAGTQTTNDNWMNGWCNFDPQNTDYSLTSAPVASITAAGSLTICPSGGSVVLNANAGSGYTYQWQLNSVNIGGATSQSYNATAAGSYNVIVSNVSGCSTTSTSIVVTNYAAPTATINAGGPVTFCQGGSVTLTASNAVSYSWSSGPSTPSITANTSGNYLVTITDINGCQATSTVTLITVNPLPTASITASGSTTFCIGDSVILTANLSTSYLWSNAATTQSITVYNSGNYTVQVTNANGCQSAVSSPITVSASSSPAPTITITGNTSLCQGGTVTLTSSTANTYLWSPGGQTTQSITTGNAGTYNVTVTNSNACNGSGVSSNVIVTVNPLPVASFTTSGIIPTVNFLNTSTGANTYSWDFGDFSTSSQASPTHTYSGNGNYTACLVAITSFGCMDTLCAPVLINVGINTVSPEVETIALYPNPANDQLNIAINSASEKDAIIVAYDATGKLMINETQTIASGDNLITYDVTNWNNGIYFVRITSNGSVKTMKVLINR